MICASSLGRIVLSLALLALTVPVAARQRPITLRIPRFTVPAHSDREICTFVRIRTREPFDLAGSSVVSLGGNLEFVTHHFIMWAYTGTDVEGFRPGRLVDSKACLDFGPADRTARSLLRTEQTAQRTEMIPHGLALRVQPTGGTGRSRVIGIILNTHWINSSARRQRAAVRVKLLPAEPGSVKRYLGQIFEATANAFLDVPPGDESREARGVWGPGLPDLGSAIFAGATPVHGVACVTSLTSHMHKRGKLFTVEFVDRDGTVSPLFETDSYSEPANRTFDPPLVVGPGQTIRYRCLHDNGRTTSQRLGCEEQPGVSPGTRLADAFFSPLGLHAAAKDCRTDADCPPTDAAYPGRSFTGRCVPARLVFGFTGNDDMCIMPGTFYDANPLAPPGQECDLGALPVIH